jgi:hypothetical protein
VWRARRFRDWGRLRTTGRGKRSGHARPCSRRCGVGHSAVWHRDSCARVLRDRSKFSVTGVKVSDEEEGRSYVEVTVINNGRQPVSVMAAGIRFQHPDVPARRGLTRVVHRAPREAGACTCRSSPIHIFSAWGRPAVLDDRSRNTSPELAGRNPSNPVCRGLARQSGDSFLVRPRVKFRMLMVLDSAKRLD